MWCQSCLLWFFLDKRNKVKIVQAYWRWLKHWWSRSWEQKTRWDFRWRKKLGRMLKSGLNAKLWNNWMTVFLLTSGVSEYDPFDPVEHGCTSVAVSTLLSVASTTVTNFDIWQRTCYQFDDAVWTTAFYTNIHRSPGQYTHRNRGQL